MSTRDTRAGLAASRTDAPDPAVRLDGQVNEAALRLTRRQRQIAALVGRGASNREIGQVLQLSERSVETYVSASLRRLGLRSRTRLALWAVAHNLARPPREGGAG